MAAFEASRIPRHGAPHCHWESSLKSTYIPARPTTVNFYSPSPTLSSRTEYSNRSVVSNRTGIQSVIKSAEFDDRFPLKKTMFRHQNVRKVGSIRSQSLSRVDSSASSNGDLFNEGRLEFSARHVQGEWIQLRGERVGSQSLTESANCTPRKTLIDAALPNLGQRSNSFSGCEKPKRFPRLKSDTQVTRTDSHSSLPGLSISQIAPNVTGSENNANGADGVSQRSSSADHNAAKTRSGPKTPRTEDGFRSKEDMLKALQKKLGTLDPALKLNPKPQTPRRQKYKAQSLRQQWVAEGVTTPFMERPQSRIVRKSPGLRSIFLRPQDTPTWMAPLAKRACPPNCACCFKVALQPEKQPDENGTTVPHNNTPMTSDDDTKKSRKVQFSV